MGTCRDRLCRSRTIRGSGGAVGLSRRRGRVRRGRTRGRSAGAGWRPCSRSRGRPSAALHRGRRRPGCAPPDQAPLHEGAAIAQALAEPVVVVTARRGSDASAALHHASAAWPTPTARSVRPSGANRRGSSSRGCTRQPAHRVVSGLDPGAVPLQVGWGAERPARRGRSPPRGLPPGSAARAPRLDLTAPRGEDRTLPSALLPGACCCIRETARSGFEPVGTPCGNRRGTGQSGRRTDLATDRSPGRSR